VNYKPCGDKLLVKPDPEEEKTASGLIRPQIAFIGLVSAVVIDTSDGFYSQCGTLIKSQFKPGDRIFYQKGQAVELEQLPGYALIMEAVVLMKEKPNKAGSLT